jgi:hypothetical protein
MMCTEKDIFLAVIQYAKSHSLKVILNYFDAASRWPVDVCVTVGGNTDTSKYDCDVTIWQ